MRRKLWAAFSGLLLVISATAQQPITVLPFFTQGVHTFIEVNVNQSPKKYVFLFDTGAGSAVVSPGLAKEAGLVMAAKDTVLETAGGKTAVPISLQNTVRLDGLDIKGVGFFIDEQAGISFRGAPVDGTIGYELLRDYITLLNYEKGQLEFYPAGTRLHREVQPVPFRLIEEIPAVEVSFTTPKGVTQKGWFYFDSGGGFSISFNAGYAAKTNLLSAFDRKAKTQAVGAGGTAFENYLATVPQLAVSSFVFNDVPVLISMAAEGITAGTQVDGVLGIDIIRRFNVAMDYRKSNIKLIPNKNNTAPFTYNLTGLALRLQEGKLVVSNVLEGSPAQRAGFLKNDVLNTIDGKSYGTVSEARNVINKEGRSFRMEVLRQGDAKTLTLKPERFY